MFLHVEPRSLHTSLLWPYRVAFNFFLRAGESLNVLKSRFLTRFDADDDVLTTRALPSGLDFAPAMSAGRSNLVK